MPTALTHDFPFDPTYGFTLDELLKIPWPDPPDDFTEFWQNTYHLAQSIPLNLAARKIPAPATLPNHDLLEIEYSSLGGERIGAWATVPQNSSPARGIVVGHGYGGAGIPAWAQPGPPAATIYPCMRGFNRSASPNYSDNAARHVLQGINSRDTYSHRGCVVDTWLAASALLQLFPRTANCLDYIGGSFGGGIGAMALPWDPRFRRAYLEVPSFGNHPLRVTMPCVGSGESVRRYHQSHPEIMAVLAYFDAATAAHFIRIPTFVAPALFDPAVPPPGQFAVYNAIPGKEGVEKKLFPRRAGHFNYPEEQSENAALLQQLETWFNP